MLPELLKQQILSQGKVEEEKFNELLSKCEATGTPVEEMLISKNILTEEEFLLICSEVLDIPYIRNLSHLKPSAEFAQRVPREFARRCSVIGLQSRENSSILVATSRPLDLYPLDEIAFRLGTPVTPVCATKEEILARINTVYASNGSVTQHALEDLDESGFEGITGAIEKSEDLLDMANKAPIVKLINGILYQALRMRASDIHIQPFVDHVRVRYRVDGILYTQMKIPKKVQEAVVSRVKVLGKMDIAERRLPQDGGMSFTAAGREVDVRISSVPCAYGERIVMRLQDKSSGIYQLDRLGMSESDNASFLRLIRLTHGIILVTGPTGSGKTTTLYAALSMINSPGMNIITIEDPIEYVLEGISQIQVSNKKGLTFAKGLRSIVRQDPDIIMVGEIRDLETLRIAIQSAMTGHLVFSTLHTNDSAGAVSRMLDLDAEPYLVNSTLLAVVAQRLVRLVCSQCKEQYIPTPEELGELGLEPEAESFRSQNRPSICNGITTRSPATKAHFASTGSVPGGFLYRGTGCEACSDTGYLGRTGIYEILVVDDVVKEQIGRRASASEIKKIAVERGLVTLRADALSKMFAGLTTPEEVIRVTQLDSF
jgi:general secretion pathway protein E